MSREWEPLLHELAGPRHAGLVAYATMLTGNRAAAEDVVQEALIATFGRRRTFPSVGHAEQYTRRAIATKFLDAARKSSKEKDSLRRAGRERQLTNDPAAAVTTSLTLEQVLATLPPRTRACVVLRYLEDLSISQTAHALGLSEGAVKRYVSDGLTRLNAALGTTDTADDMDVAGVTPQNGGAR